MTDLSLYVVLVIAAVLSLFSVRLGISLYQFKG